MTREGTAERGGIRRTIAVLLTIVAFTVVYDRTLAVVDDGWRGLTDPPQLTHWRLTAPMPDPLPTDTVTRGGNR